MNFRLIIQLVTAHRSVILSHQDRIAYQLALLVLAILLGFCMARDGRADERRFTYVYETLTIPEGGLEYEQWFTWKTSKESDRHFDRFEFRHELEYGVTDRFQIGLYLSDWSYTRGLEEEEEESGGQEAGGQERGPMRFSEGSWDDVALEAIYNLSHPVTDPIGLSLYGEIKGGDDLFELEGKLLVEKDFGPWVLAYNAAIEAEWEGTRLGEDSGKFMQTAGVSYEILPQLTVGAELLHEMSIPDWQGFQGKPELFLGPNISYRTQKWWVTATPLFQVTDVEDAEDFQMRILFGINLN